MKTKKPKLVTIGVRFPGSRNVYTYTAPLRHGIKLGDEVVVDSPYGGPQVVFVVRIDKRPYVPCGYTIDTLKRIRARLVEI